MLAHGALANVDETGISKFIPYRPGSKGLHLIEATALLIKDLPDPFRYAICERYGAHLDEEQKVEANQAIRQQIAEQDAIVRDAIRERLIWFNGEEEEIRSVLSSGQSLDRMVMVLNDPVHEAGARGILTELYGSGPQAVANESRPKGSWLGRMFRRSKKVRS